MEELENLDSEIQNLEKKLGLHKDKKRGARNDRQAEQEGFGKGFLAFLNGMEAKVRAREYRPPADDYDFLKDEHEVMLNESDLEGVEEDASGSAGGYGSED